ncbi:MAG: hypothetical protein ACTTKL_00420 [Treponema sp.]
MKNAQRKIAGVFIFLCAAALHAEKKAIGFDAALATGVPLYGSGTNAPSARDDAPHRIIFGVDADMTVKIAAPLYLLVGADTLFDAAWSGSHSAVRIDYAFFGGLKVYPNIGGLNASVAYALGRRTDTESSEGGEKAAASSAWGNGFRLSVEYDFLYRRSQRCAPVLGMYYRMMPRGGNTYDNIIAVYAGVTF